MDRVLEDDIIFDIMQWPSFFANNKISKIVTAFFLVYSILEAVFCIPLLMFQFRDNMAQYSPFIAGCVIVFVSYWALYAKHKSFCNMYHEIIPTLWPLKSSGKESFQQIQDIGTKSKNFSAFVTLLTLVSATLGLPWFGDEYDLYITIKVFKDCLGHYGVFCSTLFYAGLYHAGLTLVLNVLTFMYLVLHLVFQCILLKTELEKLGSYQKCNNEDDFLNNLVETKLIFYIKHHQNLQNYMVRVNNFLYFPILCFTFSGIICGICLIFVPKVLVRSFWRVLVAGLLALTLILTFCLLGQLLEDTNEEIDDCVNNLPWYEWNTKNKKLVLMLMGKTQRSAALSSSGIITVNYRLLIALYQKIYSGLTFIIDIS